MPKVQEVEQHPIVWKDRRRRLGLPISFTRYYIKNNRLYLSKGFFNTTENELLLYRVLDLKMKRTFGEKIFGVGTITVFTCDETDRELLLKKIKKPEKVRDMISSIVESERNRLKISGREITGVADEDTDISSQ